MRVLDDFVQRSLLVFYILFLLHMQTGQVKFYNDQKGFGFITYDGGDIFFHIKQCEEGYLPQQDDNVSFEIADGRDGRPSAINVAHAGEEMAA